MITFLPSRLDLHNNDERLRQACVDVTRWGFAVSKLCCRAQFLWEGRHGRAELLVTVFSSSFYKELLDIRYSDITLDGVSVYTFGDRNAFADDVVESIIADCHLIRLDADAPRQFAWMNVDCNLDVDLYDSCRDRVTRETILAIAEANSGITLGMFYGQGDYDTGVDFHYQSARCNSRARKLNPKARYALNCHHRDFSCNLYSILNELFEVAKMDPNFLGFVPMNTYLKASEWPGWPFNLQSVSE